MSDHSTAAMGDDNLVTPPPSAASAAEDDLENPLLSPPSPDQDPNHSSTFFKIDQTTLHKSLPFFLFFFLLTAAAVSLIITVTLILNKAEYELDPFFVSSFHVTKNPSQTTWDAKLSVNQSERGYFEEFNVAYEARSWLYLRSGFISVTSPSMSYSSDGGELILLHSDFTMREVEEQGIVRDRALILDLLIEANATRKKPNASGSYLMIECGDLKIEFAVNQSFGTLCGDGGARSCGVQIFPTKADALKRSPILDRPRMAHSHPHPHVYIDDVNKDKIVLNWNR